MQRGEYSIVDNNSISINAVREQRVEALCHAHRLSISRVIPSALRVGRAPILLTRPLWTSWVKDRSCRLTVGFDSPDVNSFGSARHELI